jgi:hypothetical protein
MKTDINVILAKPENKGCSQYGAQMGRQFQTEGKPECLHLQKLRMVDGAYDTGGAYWGMGTPIYCAFSPEDTENDIPIRVFCRAHNREEAKEEILRRLGNKEFTFFR